MCAVYIHSYVMECVLLELMKVVDWLAIIFYRTTKVTPQMDPSWIDFSPMALDTITFPVEINLEQVIAIKNTTKSFKFYMFSFR